MGKLKQLHIDCEYRNCIVDDQDTCMMYDEPPEDLEGMDYDPYFDEDKE